MFGIRFDLRNPAIAGTSMAERYACALDQCAWAERLGFASITLSEHHGVDDGYLPSALTMAAAVAARTTTIRIRVAAVVGALHHPLRLAEEAAVVDNLSGGRLDLVVANGYVPAEFAMFGDDIANRVSRVAETVRVLRQAFTGEPFEFRGTTVQVTPQPAQRPGVPILLGAASEPAARRAARIADGLIPADPRLWDVYRDELAVLGRRDPGPLPGGGIGSLFLADDPDEMWRRIAPFALHEMNSYGRWAADSGAMTGYQPMTDAAAVRAMGIYTVLTPDEAVARLNAAGRHATTMFHPLMGGLPPDLSWTSLRLFEERVLPHIGG